MLNLKVRCTRHSNFCITNMITPHYNVATVQQGQNYNFSGFVGFRLVKRSYLGDMTLLHKPASCAINGEKRHIS